MGVRSIPTRLTDSPFYWRQVRENAVAQLLQSTRELEGAQVAERLEVSLERDFGVSISPQV